VSQDFHDQTPPQQWCPWWCVDREYQGRPDHPARHEGHLLRVDADLPNTLPIQLFAQLVQPLGATVGLVLLGRYDDDLVTLGSAPARSLAAALVRLADVLEGVAPM
jgi:hypothetical protein